MLWAKLPSNVAATIQILLRRVWHENGHQPHLPSIAATHTGMEFFRMYRREKKQQPAGNRSVEKVNGGRRTGRARQTTGRTGFIGGTGQARHTRSESVGKQRRG